MGISKGTARIITICLSIIASVVVAAAFSLPGIGKAENVKAANGVVTVPVSKLKDGKARFYKFADGGKEIAFFVVKATDGTIRTAFDACDSCYRDRKGYEQKESTMLCRNCNQRFAINKLGPNATGGCNPGYLPHKEAGGNVIISVADLRSGLRYF